MADEKKQPISRAGVATSLRISPAALSLWEQLAAREGLNRTAYLEMTLRRLAAEKGIGAEGEEAPA